MDEKLTYILKEQRQEDGKILSEIMVPLPMGPAMPVTLEASTTTTTITTPSQISAQNVPVSGMNMHAHSSYSRPTTSTDRGSSAGPSTSSVPNIGAILSNLNTITRPQKGMPPLTRPGLSGKLVVIPPRNSPSQSSVKLSPHNIDNSSKVKKICSNLDEASARVESPQAKLSVHVDDHSKAGPSTSDDTKSLPSLTNTPQQSPQTERSNTHDPYCFICHTKENKRTKGPFVCCPNCPISVHRKHFAGSTRTFGPKCPKTHIKDPNKANTICTIAVLNELLQFTIEILSHNEGVLEFDDFIKESQDAGLIFNPITLASIRKKIMDRAYTRIEQFQYDILVVEHNLKIGKNRPSQKVLREFIESFNNELVDLMACHHCYSNFYKTSAGDNYHGFNLPCPIGHPVVWVLNDYFRVWWPAKILKSIDPKYDFECRFFGERKFLNLHGSFGSDRVLTYSKKEPKNNETLFKKYAQRCKEEVDLRKEFNDALRCVETYLKSYDFKLPELPGAFGNSIPKLKLIDGKIGSKRVRSSSSSSSSSTDSSSSEETSSLPTSSSSTIPKPVPIKVKSQKSSKNEPKPSTSVIRPPDANDDNEDLDCVIVEDLGKPLRPVASTSKGESSKESMKFVINTKTNIIKPAASMPKDLKDMNYEDLLAHDPELRDCVQTLQENLEKVMKNIEFFNENAFKPEYPTVRKLMNNMNEDLSAISKLPKRICDSCQDKEVDLNYFCCQYGIYCCADCKRDDKKHETFCMKIPANRKE